MNDEKETGDYLAVFDGEFEPEKEYCGNANGNPITYNSTEKGSSMYLQFKTDEKNRGVGFILGYKEIGMLLTLLDPILFLTLIP